MARRETLINVNDEVFPIEERRCRLLKKVLFSSFIPSNLASFYILILLAYLITILSDMGESNFHSREIRLHYYTILCQLFITSTIIFFLSSPRFPKKYFSIVNISAIILGFILFEKGSYIPILNHATVSSSQFEESSGETTALLLVILFGYVPVVCYTFYRAWLEKRMLMHILLFFVPVLFNVSTFFIFLRPIGIGFHLHHWFTFALLAILARFDTLTSRFIHNFALGAYLQGTLRYGTDYLGVVCLSEG